MNPDAMKYIALFLIIIVCSIIYFKIDDQGMMD